MKLDPWQKDFLQTKGDKMLLCGRQVGKSVICSLDAALFAKNNPNKTTLIIAPTERQAYALFDKTLQHFTAFDLKTGKHRPTKHKLELKNGSKIWCLPTGISGVGIRFLTIDRLYIDECQNVGEEVRTAVTPMLLTTAGDKIYLGTPKPNSFFVKEFMDQGSTFTKFSVKSEEVLRDRDLTKEWTEYHRQKALDYIEGERRYMTKLQFAQEYEGEIIQDLHQFFSRALIESCMTIDPHSPRPVGKPYLGVDVASMGRDETVLISGIKTKSDKMVMYDMSVLMESRITSTARSIIDADIKEDYLKIYVDDGGLGVGVFHLLLEHPQTSRKVIAINNASRSLDRDDNQHKRLLKEDLYTNLKRLMEQGRIKLWKDDELLLSLQSVQFEYKNNRMILFGDNTHKTEALIRCAWAMMDKSLNIFIY